MIKLEHLLEATEVDQAVEDLKVMYDTIQFENKDGFALHLVKHKETGLIFFAFSSLKMPEKYTAFDLTPEDRENIKKFL